jgi:hypothetical protein
LHSPHITGFNIIFKYTYTFFIFYTICCTLNKTLYFTRHGQSTQNIFESTLISNYSKIKYSKHEAKVRSLCTTNSVEDKECIGIFKNYVESGNMWGMQAF